MQSPKKKKSDLKIEKDNYLRHLSRLEKLRQGRSPEQIRRDLEEKNIRNNINTLRKMHSYSKTFRMKELQEYKRKTHYDSFNRVKSVVKQSFSWKPLSIPPKHKASLAPLLKENARIYNRLQSVKPMLNAQHFKTRNENFFSKENTCSTDFSKLYLNSRMNKVEGTSFSLRLGKAKENIKLRFSITSEQFLSIFKDKDNLYSFEVACGKYHSKTINFVPCEYPIFDLCVKVPKIIYGLSKVTIRILRILDQKDLVRGTFEISGEQIQSLEVTQSLADDFHCSILNARGKVQGNILVTLEQI